ncbi:MAG: hypothetical protein IH948_10585 [Bacteroidetes bacterium]|nr:hypothetical protein [Bacteroidota bacterium]
MHWIGPNDALVQLHCRTGRSSKQALVFGKLVPFFAKSGVEVGRSREKRY